MAIRISGLNSGLDTDSIVQELVSAYSTKKDNYVKAQTKLSWKQSAWKSLNTKIYSLYTGVSSLRYTSAYSLKTTSCSNSSKASVTAADNAVNGTQTLQIKKMAAAGYLTGGKVATNDGSTLSTSTTLSQLGYDETDGTVNINGKSISVSGTDTITNVLTKFKNAGVNASFDATNRRFFISSKESGLDNEFTLTSENTSGANALYAMGLSVSSDSSTSYYTSAASKYAVFTDTLGGDNAVTIEDTDKIVYDSTSGVYQLVDSNNDVKGYYNADKTKESIAEKIKSGEITTSATSNSEFTKNAAIVAYINKLNASDTAEETQKIIDGYKDYKAYEDKADKLNEAGFSMSMYETITSLGDNDRKELYFNGDGDPVTITANETTDEDGNTVTTYTDSNGNNLVKKTDDDGVERYYVADEDGNVADDAVGYKTADEQLEVYKQALVDVGFVDEDGNADFDAFKEARAAATEYYSANYADIDTIANIYDAQQAGTVDTLYEDSVTAATEALEGITTHNMAGATGNGTSVNADAVRINASDAEIVLNGATYTGKTNSFSINGLTIQALSTTSDGETLSITTSTDNQGIYDKVKDFLSQYNDLINEMTSLYNAASASGYEPLTSEEKDALTDTEVEDWEAKIKSALLRKDSTLSGVMNAMTTGMSASHIMGKDSSGTVVTFTKKNDGSYTGDDGKTYTAVRGAGGKYTFTATDGSTVSASTYSWSSFGVQTLGYLNAETNEQNAYHIYGDEDDDAVSDKDDKLMTMINSDPDMVIAFLKNATSSLYTNLGNKMGSTTLSSIYTVYNDKQMAQEYSDYTDTIKKWEDKVSDMEDSYYSKFSAMESALATLQSQSSSLSSLLS